MHITPTLENHMEKNMENDMTCSLNSLKGGMYRGLCRGAL